MCGSKLKFTSSYHPQADPAERSNRQVMEALRAAVTTVAQYDEWDLALPHITFDSTPISVPLLNLLHSNLHMGSRHGYR